MEALKHRLWKKFLFEHLWGAFYNEQCETEVNNTLDLSALGKEEKKSSILRRDKTRDYGYRDKRPLNIRSRYMGFYYVGSFKSCMNQEPTRIANTQTKAYIELSIHRKKHYIIHVAVIRSG